MNVSVHFTVHTKEKRYFVKFKAYNISKLTEYCKNHDVALPSEKLAPVARLAKRAIETSSLDNSVVDSKMISCVNKVNIV